MERSERLIVRDFKQDDIKTHREKLMQGHRVRKRLDDIQTAARKLVCVVVSGLPACLQAASSREREEACLMLCRTCRFLPS